MNTRKIQDLLLMMNFNISTLNLCLGLKNKKDLVKNILIQNKIGVLSMQETEVERTFDKTLLKNTRLYT